MKWQIKFAWKNISEISKVEKVVPVGDEALKISIRDHADIIAVISEAVTITADLAVKYHSAFPNMDFLCGYRKECVWEGQAIDYLEAHSIGWGNAGTLLDAVQNGAARGLSHKHFFFSYRLLKQSRVYTKLVREFDRVFTITLNNGRVLRVGMILEYEPTADVIRSFYDRFGPIDIAWNINPNGDPTTEALKAAETLDCRVMKWDELREVLRSKR